MQSSHLDSLSSASCSWKLTYPIMVKYSFLFTIQRCFLEAKVWYCFYLRHWPLSCHWLVLKTSALLFGNWKKNVRKKTRVQWILKNPSPMWTPHFGSTRFLFDGELDFYFRKNDLYWLKKWLGVATYFCFIFKRVNKIRKKTLSVTPGFGQGDLRKKTGSGSGVKLLIGKIR